MHARWRTPAEWWRTRLQMRPTQLAEPGTCAACGRYLMGGIRHWHYTLRWISGFREPGPSKAPIDVVLSAPPGMAAQFLRIERAGFSLPLDPVYRPDGSVALRLRRRDLPW